MKSRKVVGQRPDLSSCCVQWVCIEVQMRQTPWQSSGKPSERVVGQPERLKRGACRHIWNCALQKHAVEVKHGRPNPRGAETTKVVRQGAAQARRVQVPARAQTQSACSHASTLLPMPSAAPYPPKYTHRCRGTSMQKCRSHKSQTRTEKGQHALTTLTAHSSHRHSPARCR